MNAAKAELFEMGTKLVQELWSKNGIDPVPIIDAPNLKSFGQYVSYGFYRQKGKGGPKILVNVARTRMPVKNPVRSWTYPGYKADLTAIGVTAHESGHHIWHFHGMDDRSSMIDYICDWEEILRLEPAVSGYEPRPDEAFAEAMKLFTTNPELLREGRPNRYAFITEELEIKPLTDMPWREVLKDANPRFIQAAENWIKRHKRSSAE